MPPGESPDRADATLHQPGPGRRGLARLFTLVEDAAYLGLGILLTACAAVALFNAAAAFLGIVGTPSVEGLVMVLDRLLLVLMIVELLYTVKVSFREHTLVPEPFLIVGLIAATRRILVVTAQFAVLAEKPNDLAFRSALWELGLLTVLVVALVGSLWMLRERKRIPSAESD
jgi:uncharacterized membrane protein (DUF373 family)